jgi:hypothetical protein
MKKLLLSAFSFFAVSAVFAQSQLQIINAPTVVYGGYQQPVLTATFPIMNTGTQAADVKVARKVISEVIGSENNFCWGINCYNPLISVSPDMQTIAANTSNSSFIADYTPNGYSGITTIRYSFFKVNGSSPDSVHTTIQFRATSPLGTKKDMDTNAILDAAFPNPANAFTKIPYNLPAGTKNAKLRLMNAIGGLVSEVNLDKQGLPVIIVTDNLPAGIYFYNLQVDGRAVSTKKLIVKH